MLFRSLLANGEITAALLALDLPDFTAWVKTGVSPKYASERILGRWRIDVASVLLSIRRQRGNIPPAEFAMTRMVMQSLLSPLRFKFMPDGRYVVSQVAGAAAPAAAAAPAEQVPAAGMDPGLASRYGLGRRGPGGMKPGVPGADGNAGVAQAKPALPKLELPKELKDEGRWERTADGKYSLSKAGGGGPSPEASFNELGRLVVPIPALKGSLVLIPSN